MTTNAKAALVAALKAAKEKSSGQGQRTTTSTGDNASYPFWKMNVDEDALLRFLPDGDEANPFFWTNLERIKLPFAGQEGGDYPTSKQVEVTIPCVEMWGEKCPVIEAIRPWWKDEARKPTARIYYKKVSYIFQGFVKASPFAEENAPENPIRRFIINKSIFKKIEDSLMDPDIENMPTDYLSGLDFRIKKEQRGEYANYDNSKFIVTKPRSLDEQELLAIDQYKLFDLKQFKGEKPDADRIAAIKAMFEDSLAGRPFDFASYGHYYRAYGGGNGGGGNDDNATASAPAYVPAAVAAAPAPVVQAAAPVAAAAPVTEAAAAPAGASPQDLLAMIRNRTQANS
jgi:hypothetical protein